MSLVARRSPYSDLRRAQKSLGTTYLAILAYAVEISLQNPLAFKYHNSIDWEQICFSSGMGKTTARRAVTRTWIVQISSLCIFID